MSAGGRTSAALPGLDRRAADVRPPLSPQAVDRIVHAAAGLLGAVDGLAKVADVPTTIAAPLLAPDALRLRSELVRAGVISGHPDRRA